MDIQKILNKLRITELNEMQQHAAEALLGSDGDVVLLSPTGSGKTLAYLLPLVQLVSADSDEVQALVVTPGRELALQSDTVLKDMGCGLRSMSCYGGRPTMDEHRQLKDVKPHIVFGTPGRLNDHLDKQNISPYAIRYLIIDEFDKCLEMGFRAEMQKLLKSSASEVAAQVAARIAASRPALCHQCRGDTPVRQHVEEGHAHRLPV